MSFSPFLTLGYHPVFGLWIVITFTVIGKFRLRLGTGVLGQI